MLRGECPDVAAFLTDLSNAVQQCSGEEGGWLSVGGHEN